MRRQLKAVLFAVAILATGCFFTSPAGASPHDEYTGTHFGANNLPPGCAKDSLKKYENNACFHMRTDMNGLDSPQVDVLIMLPASPTAERDMRIMRQAVEMWDGGVHYLAPQMGLDWLGRGMHFNIAVDIAGATTNGFNPYPIVDPEIVVLATNPVGGIGIGVDPVATASLLFGGAGDVPCTGLRNPFDFDVWKSVPGFDHHHAENMGTYVEDCNGAGGNVCFAINGAIDPDARVMDFFTMFDLVAHEFGHCLTIGHVGDGAEGPWAKVPTNDIMSYNSDPPGLSKCVSTLDVEGIATRMSHYLDVNGDHRVTAKDRVLANDQPGDGLNPFQTQHPRDHLYASSTGAPTDCPQPDLHLTPGARTDWQPDPVTTTSAVLSVTTPSDNSEVAKSFTVAGTVAHAPKNEPKSPNGRVTDARDDAKTRATDITSLEVGVAPWTLNATLHLVDLPALTTAVTAGTAYSVFIDGRRFDSFVRASALDGGGALTWDVRGKRYLPFGSSTWDPKANTVTFALGRAYLAAADIDAPYVVVGQSNLGAASLFLPDDRAPEFGHSVGVASASTRAASSPVPLVPRAQMQSVAFKHPGGNTFQPTDSSLNLGVRSLADPIDPSHHYELDVPQRSDVSFTLDWDGQASSNDLDLYVTDDADSGSAGATTNRPETISLSKVVGHLDITVEPSIVTAPTGVNYTLTAVVTPRPRTDADKDGVFDEDDVCPTIKGEGADGCPTKNFEHIYLYVDGQKVATQGVDTANGSDSFGVLAEVAKGSHTLKIEWEAFGHVLATKTLYIHRR